MSASFAVRLDYSVSLQDDRDMAVRVAGILSRNTFKQLERVRADSPRQESDRFPNDIDTIVRLATDKTFRSLSFESSGRELIAGARLDTVNARGTPGATPLSCAIARRVGDDSEAFVSDVCALADALGAAAGFIAIEPRFLLAYKLASGGSIPDARDGLAELRRVGRRGYDFHSERIATSLATIEWGTFLGPSHLERIDLARLRSSGAFAHVHEVSPSLAFLQLTEDPSDDLSGALELRIVRAREVLAPILMDIRDVVLG